MLNKTIPITYLDEDGNSVTDEVRVKRMKVLARAKLFDDLRAGLKPGEEPGATAWAMLGLKIITGSMIDGDGKLFMTVDQINDDWEQEKINAYKKAIDDFQKPNVEDVAKNSTATAGAPSS